MRENMTISKHRHMLDIFTNHSQHVNPTNICLESMKTKYVKFDRQDIQEVI